MKQITPNPGKLCNNFFFGLTNEFKCNFKIHNWTWCPLLDQAKRPKVCVTAVESFSRSISYWQTQLFGSSAFFLQSSDENQKEKPHNTKVFLLTLYIPLWRRAIFFTTGIPIYHHNETYQNYVDGQLVDYLERYYGHNINRLIQVNGSMIRIITIGFPNQFL